jgi:uncharacterized protein
MQNHRRALLLGTSRREAPFHPIDPLADSLPDILGPDYSVEVSTLPADFMKASEFGLLVLAVDLWDQPFAAEHAGALLSFVAQGGGLVVVHSGISVQSKSELAEMIGARFTGHPDRQDLLLSPVADHPVVEGVDAFAVFDEPYMFQTSGLAEMLVFLEYTLDERLYPAGWLRDYGIGRVVFLMPGHSADVFEHPTYRRLIHNAAEWATGQHSAHTQTTEDT